MSNYALIDSNVILDILTNDPNWAQWSINTLEYYSDYVELAINPIIYAELSIDFQNIEDLDEALILFKRLPLPFEAGFLAGKAFLNYRKNQGERKSTLPVFYIGAHAAISNLSLITRDKMYKTYFPTLNLISPERY